MEKLLLVDGNSLLNRAYYAFGAGGGLSFAGAPTNATFGFMNMFLRAVADEGATRAAVAFDMRGKTFRHEKFAGYKAHRKGMPDELAIQLSDLKNLLGVMGVAVLQKQGYEGDDIIGTVARRIREDGGCGTVILSADRDGLQLVDECTEIHLTIKGVTNLDVWDVARVRAEFNLTPAQLIDLKALMGDKSDNIPGAAGIGEKTALGLMQQYGSLDKIYESIGTVQGSAKEKLAASKDMVYLSRELAEINKNVPCDFDTGKFAFGFPMGKDVYDAFWQRGFKSLCKRPNLWEGDFYGSDAPADLAEKPVSVKTKTIEISELCDLKNIIAEAGKVKRIAVGYDKNAYYLCHDPATEYKIKLFTDLLSGGFDDETVLENLKPLLESNVEKAVFNSKTFKEKLKSVGDITLRNVVTDAKLCDHLLATRTTELTPQQLFSHYGVETACFVAPLLTIDFMAKLASVGMLALYREIELPLVDVLLEMQQTGVKIDMTALQKVSDELSAQISDLSAQIYKQAGENFNINSPQQMGGILFKKLGIETTVKTKTGLSTNEAVLQKIYSRHPIVPLILRYRKTYKLWSTYIQGYKNLADAGGFVHSSFNNTATVTGRLSSSEPNLQNIPARSDESAIVRKIFVSRFPGGWLLACDYSQIELRLLAHFSGDEVMLAAFKNNRDIHTETACKIFGVDPKLVTPDMRRQAKAVNFGIIYGISAFGLSENTGIPVAEAARFIERYFAQFPHVKTFLDRCRDEAVMNGFAVTLMGRRRLLPELVGTNHNTVQFGIRAAMNMPMQGSASDIIKKAMITIAAKMADAKFKSVMVTQVHDELVFDCHPDEVERIRTLATEVMRDVVQLKVPLEVGTEVKETL